MDGLCASGRTGDPSYDGRRTAPPRSQIAGGTATTLGLGKHAKGLSDADVKISYKVSRCILHCTMFIYQGLCYIFANEQALMF